MSHDHADLAREIDLSWPKADFLAHHLGEVETSAVRIRQHINRTRLLRLDPRIPELRLKLENEQLTGSFKARGAFNALLSLLRDHPSLEGVVAMSSGNHGKAVAYAAQTLGVKASVIVPHDSSSAKLSAVTAYGAELIAEGVTLENRDEEARRVQLERGIPMIHPFDDWMVIHGQGTIALEILEDEPDTKCIVLPVGGGGLLSGVALAGKGMVPDLRVIGVEPAAADDARQTLLSGQRVRLSAPPSTVADGVRTLEIGRRTYEVMVGHGLVDQIVTVDEDEIVRGLRFTRGLGLAIEPTAALPIAAWLSGRLEQESGPIAMVVTGGNFDEATVQALLRR